MTQGFNLSRRAALALALMFGTLAASVTLLFLQDTAVSTPADGPVIEEMTLGNPDAPITMVEYASFTCPHCQHFHQEVMPLIRKDYIDAGKVRLIYRPIYFDRLGLWSDMMARCGGNLRYFGIATMLYDQQSEWTQGENALAIVNNLYAIGRVAGLQDADMESCIQNADLAKALVAKSTADSTADNIQGTPTFVINGELFNNQPYEAFVAKFDSILAQ